MAVAFAHKSPKANQRSYGRSTAFAKSQLLRSSFSKAGGELLPPAVGVKNYPQCHPLCVYRFDLLATRLLPRERKSAARPQAGSGRRRISPPAALSPPVVPLSSASRLGQRCISLSHLLALTLTLCHLLGAHAIASRTSSASQICHHQTASTRFATHTAPP